jgi:putative glutamine amidotransferase
MKKPIIGISSNFTVHFELPNLTYDRLFVNYAYANSIIAAGGIPIVLPIIDNASDIYRQVEAIDGLLLTGGQDVSPLLYGEEPDVKLENTYPRRDAFEFQLLHAVYQLKKPILGICRGLQLINVAFKGTLYQDVSLRPDTHVKHCQNYLVDEPTHTIHVSPDTVLHSIFEKDRILVNSWHHQCVKELADGFTCSATAKDGLVEAFEKMDNSFLLAVQWHPELTSHKDPDMLKLFQRLVNEAAPK